MYILYIHGLDSKLSPEKREILQKFGQVVSPDLNYYENPDAIDSILQEVEEEEIDVVIGSSMGGFAAYYVSAALGKPALLFNPALKKCSVKQNIPNPSAKSARMKQFVLGAKDDVVDPVDTFEFLADNFTIYNGVHLHLRPELTHNIPLDVFEEEVTSFVKRSLI